MSFTLIDHVAIGGISSDSTGPSGSINTTGADFLVAVATCAPGGTSTVSDSKSNTWNALTLRTGSLNTCIYWCVPTTVGSAHTFQHANTGHYPSLEVSAWSGAKQTTPNDGSTGADLAGGSSGQAGSITPAENNELLIAGIAFNSTTTPTINGSFTISDYILNGGTHYGSAMAYLVQTSLAAANPTWSGATLHTVALASFKIAAGGGSPPTLSSITPSSGYANATTDVTFTGVALVGTHLDGTTPVVNVPGGWTASSLSVSSATAATFNLKVPAGTSPGGNNISFTTDSGSSSNVTFTVSNPSGGSGGHNNFSSFIFGGRSE